MTPPLNLDELEAKARAATPPDCDSRDIHPGNPVWGPRLAKFREAATPEAVTALCARVMELEEWLREALEHLEGYAADHGRVVIGSEDRIGILRALLAKGA